MKTRALSIAGFDGSGGAGLQADLKTFSALGVYGMSVLTALPVQNTQGVKSVWPLPTDCVLEQLVAIFEDIDVHAIKIGMLFDAAIIESVASFLQAHAKKIPIVIDPVMVAKNGGLLLKHDAIDALKQKLIPLATVCTPNLPEAEVLLGKKIDGAAGMLDAANELNRLGSRSYLLKGGHLENDDARDLFVEATNLEWLESKRIVTRNTHGTGCTLSAAIAVFLAKGYSSREACLSAKVYLTRAIIGARNVQIGKGHGPVHHFCDWW